MGWLDTPQQQKGQHVQIIAGGNIKDVDRIHERDTRRGITGIFWILFILSSIFTFSYLYLNEINRNYLVVLVPLFFLLVLMFRYGFFKKKPSRRKSKRVKRRNTHKRSSNRRRKPSRYQRKSRRR